MGVLFESSVDSGSNGTLAVGDSPYASVSSDGSQIGVLLDLSRFTFFMKIDRRKWV